MKFLILLAICFTGCVSAEQGRINKASDLLSGLPDATPKTEKARCIVIVANQLLHAERCKELPEYKAEMMLADVDSECDELLVKVPDQDHSAPAFWACAAQLAGDDKCEQQLPCDPFFDNKQESQEKKGRKL